MPDCVSSTVPLWQVDLDEASHATKVVTKSLTDFLGNVVSHVTPIPPDDHGLLWIVSCEMFNLFFLVFFSYFVQLQKTVVLCASCNFDSWKNEEVLCKVIERTSVTSYYCKRTSVTCYCKRTSLTLYIIRSENLWHHSTCLLKPDVIIIFLQFKGIYVERNLRHSGRHL